MAGRADRAISVSISESHVAILFFMTPTGVPLVGVWMSSIFTGYDREERLDYIHSCFSRKCLMALHE
jgi:hypothetical protein